MRVYVDTNVFMDFLEDRNSSAHRFFIKAISCMYTVVISEIIIKELRFQNVDINPLLKILESKIEGLLVTNEDKLKAKTLPTHYNDALHICIAERAEVEAIITRNKKDFKCTNIPVKSTDDL